MGNQRIRFVRFFLTENFKADSDIDVLIVFIDPHKYRLFDLVEKRTVEASENYIRKKNILRSRRVIMSEKIYE
jgi:predicted nucleotidyltransferase